MVKRSSKKSETLEVRISYDTKQKLSERAALEGRTVSELVRTLCTSYLANDSSHTESSFLGEFVMRAKNFIFQKPKTVLAGLLAVAGSTMLMMPSAAAQDFTLEMQGEVMLPVSEPIAGVRIRKFSTDISLGFNSPIVLGLDGQKLSNDRLPDGDGTWMTIIVREASGTDNKNAVYIFLSIVEKLDSKETVLADPVLLAVYDQSSKTVSEADGATYSFKFVPRTKS